MPARVDRSTSKSLTDMLAEALQGWREEREEKLAEFASELNGFVPWVSQLDMVMESSLT